MILKLIKFTENGPTTTELECTILGRSLNCFIVRDSNQQYKLINKYCILNPDEAGVKLDEW